MAFTLLNSFALLDSMVLQGQRKTFVQDPNSTFKNKGTYQYTPFSVENASVQPLTDKNQLLLAEGIREYEAYTIFTSTLLKSAEETTVELADQVLINGLFGESWFTVLRSKKYSITSNGSQFEVTVVKYPNKI